MTPRPMHPDEDREVRALAALCHPDKAERPEHFHFAFPTLVLVDDGAVIAATSFTLSPTVRGYVGYGVDLFVHPDYRARGYGRRLAETRVAIARTLGAVDFVGVDHAGASMIPWRPSRIVRDGRCLARVFMAHVWGSLVARSAARRGRGLERSGRLHDSGFSVPRLHSLPPPHHDAGRPEEHKGCRGRLWHIELRCVESVVECKQRTDPRVSR